MQQPHMWCFLYWHAWVFHVWVYGRFIEIQSNLRRKKCHRTYQGSNFLGGSFSNGNNVRASIQFRRQSHGEHLKRWFFLKNRSTYFTSITPLLLDQSNETSWVFPASKSTNHFLPQSTVFYRSDSGLEVNDSCCHKSDAWSHLE